MKKGLILLAGVLLLMSFYCNKETKEPETPSQDTTANIQPPEGVNPEYLTQYSWKEYKYFIVEGDSVYDVSYLFLGDDECDTLISTYDDNGVYYRREKCSSVPYIEYWTFSDDYRYIALFYDAEHREIEELYEVKSLTADTLKLRFVDIYYKNKEKANTQEDYYLLIYYTAIPKEEY